MSLYLASTLLGGVRHGFSTREGGVSAGPFASLNLGRKTGDDEANVAENHRRLAEAAGYRELVSPEEQVHGDRVVDVRTETAGACDALIGDATGPAIGIRVADCVPVLLWDPSRGVIGAVHAGWRGVAASIVPKAVRRLGGHASDVRAAVGPAIGGCCYEVDDATLEAIADATPGPMRSTATRPGHARVDLRAAVGAQLSAFGVEQIEFVGRCTACDREHLFSHRRDQGRTGRHLAFIGGGA